MLIQQYFYHSGTSCFLSSQTHFMLIKLMLESKCTFRYCCNGIGLIGWLGDFGVVSVVGAHSTGLVFGMSMNIRYSAR